MSNLYGYGLGETTDSSGSSGSSWSDILGSVVKGYTQIETARQQAKTAQAIATSPNYSIGVPASYSGTYTTAASVNSMMPVLLIGGAALALLFFAMKKD
jgi:hypothetical protein